MDAISTRGDNPAKNLSIIINILNSPGLLFCGLVKGVIIIRFVCKNRQRPTYVQISSATFDILNHGESLSRS